jgi:hypothetical protein
VTALPGIRIGWTEFIRCLDASPCGFNWNETLKSIWVFLRLSPYHL